tara:strand:+ start:2133 stop:2513 length:381 start_codon:yes stop_codon:yes gene_type:complete
MRNLFLILLFTTFALNAEEVEYKEGNEFQAKKYEALALYFYRADATRVNIARDLNYSLSDFLTYASVDSRDIYKIRKGEKFVLKESFRDGDIFEVNLESERTFREKYFVLSRDLKNSSIYLVTEES